MSKECVTHHYACDCREEDFKKALAACVEYRAKLDKLERENSTLREQLITVTSELTVTKANALADKERLDWLARNRSVSATERPLSVTPESLRASIDAARKAQP